MESRRQNDQPQEPLKRKEIGGAPGRQENAGKVQSHPISPALTPPFLFTTPKVLSYVQLTLGSISVLLFLTWLVLLAWEIARHEVLVEDYLSGFLAWAVITDLLRRLVVSAFQRREQ